MGLVAVVLVVVGALLVDSHDHRSGASAGGDHGSRPSRSTSPPTTAAAVARMGRTYLSLERPVDRVLVTFSSEASHWTATTPLARAADQAGPVVAGLHSLAVGLGQDPWPPAAHADIVRLSAEVSALESTLGGIGSVTVFDAANLSSAVAREVVVLGQEENVVRTDLGLPPLPA